MGASGMTVPPPTMTSDPRLGPMAAAKAAGAQRKTRPMYRCLGRLPEVIDQDQVGLTLIDARIEQILAVGRDGECRPVAEFRIVHTEDDGALLCGEIVKGNYHGAG